MPALETRFAVSEAEAAAYRTAIGLSGSAVPTGVLMRLLADETVLSWLRSLFGARIPIHIRQAAEIFTPLQAGQAYDIVLSCPDTDAATPLLEMQAKMAGEVAVKLSITLALVEAKP